MKTVFAAAMVVMLAGPAFAQGQDKMPTMEQMMDAKTPDQIEKERAADQAYKESLKKIPDAKTSSDPWGSARGADAAKPTASSAAKIPKKPMAKAGSAVN